MLRHCAKPLSKRRKHHGKGLKFCRIHSLNLYLCDQKPTLWYWLANCLQIAQQDQRRGCSRKARLGRVAIAGASHPLRMLGMKLHRRLREYGQDWAANRAPLVRKGSRLRTFNR